jgi:hypothetical protein
VGKPARKLGMIAPEKVVIALPQIGTGETLKSISKGRVSITSISPKIIWAITIISGSGGEAYAYGEYS